MPFSAPALLAPLLVGATFHVGTFQKTTAAAPAMQTVNHGLGVVPKALVLWSAGNVGSTVQTVLQFSLGMTDGTTTQCMGGATEGGVAMSTTARRLAPKMLSFVSGNQQVLSQADFVSWDATGFTLSWGTNDAQLRQVHFLAIGGDTVQAQLVAWNMPLAPGTDGFSGLMFSPDLVLNAYVGSTSPNPDTLASDLHLNFGVMDPRGQQWTVGAHELGGRSPTACARAATTVGAIVLVDAPPTFYMEGSLVSLDSSGATLDFTRATGAGGFIFSLALAGLRAQAGTFDVVATGSGQAVTGVGFKPEAVLLSTTGDPTLTAEGLSGVRMSLGATDGTRHATSGVWSADSVTTTAVSSFDTQAATLSSLASAGDTVALTGEVASFDPDGFTMSWPLNDGSSAQVLYLALASLPADAGTPDAGMPDAGAHDAGMQDAGAPDGGAMDAGAPDAGAPDAGAPDAGAMDAGMEDAGAPDAGAADAGAPDAGAPDAGALDAGPPDAGASDAAVMDAGPPMSSSSLTTGCGCAGSGATPVLLAALLWGLRRRKSRA
jgi:uncharacterized protein (TIGR03382 family)